ncbi:ATP-binding protein [Streptomyces sp. NPDC001761]
MSEPVLLLGAGSLAAGAEFLLARIAAAHPVVLVDANAPAWARPYLVKHIPTDPAHYRATAGAVSDYVQRHDVRGVLSYVPDHLVTVSRLAGHLHLPAPPVESQSVLSDRVALRRLLARHNVPQPRMSVAVDAAAAAACADAIGYPVLIKGRTRTDVGNFLAHDRTNLLDACHRLTRSPLSVASKSGEIVVEKYIQGAAVSAETVVLPDGDVRIVAITRTTAEIHGSLNAMRHSVYAHDSLLHNPVIRRIIQRAVQAIGVTFGVLRVSMKLTSLGPRITGIQAHLARDFIPLLVNRATGIDLARISADLACGRTPDFTSTRQRAAAIHFAYPSVSGCIENLAISPEAAHQPLMERMVPLQKVGNQVIAPPDARPGDRLAYWVALGTDAAHCGATLDDVTKYLRVDIVTRPPATMPHSRCLART